VRYLIQQKIRTLIENAVSKDGYQNCGFDAGDVSFSQWDAEAQIESGHYSEAYFSFQQRLRKLVPKISFVGQCTIESRTQPFLIRRLDSNVAFVRFIHIEHPWA
jgi:hypothetical protein